MKHTPGPWKFEENNDQCAPIITATTGAVVAIHHGTYDSEPHWEITDADARLIAAAPELLDALKAIRPYLNAGEALIADRAIAKATGGK